MQRFGIYLLILGIGAFLLPLTGYQFRLMSAFGDSQFIVAGAVAVVGLVLLVVGTMRKRAGA